MTRRSHLRGDPLVVEVVEHLIVHDDAAPPGPALQFLGAGEQFPVVVEEAVPGLPVPLHQRMTDKQVPGRGRVGPRVADLARGHDRQAVKGDLLQGHRRTAAGVPVRLTVGVPHQVRGQWFGPFRLDPGRGASPQPRGLDEFGDDDPGRWLPGQRRVGEDGEPRSPRPRELAKRAALPARLLVGVRMPMCDRSPDSSEMWICWARPAGISFRSWPGWPAGASGARAGPDMTGAPSLGGGRAGHRGRCRG